jgi:uncharacterized membrane protein YphA (DoxX/SURF4 family)
VKLRVPQGPISTAIGVIASVVLGGVFVVAGLLKSADPQLFAQQIRGYQMAPDSLSLPMAYGFILIELLLGIAAILQIARKRAVISIMALLVIFIFATAWAWAHGNAEDCGCFGRAAARGPQGVILEDILFLLIGAVAFVCPELKNWKTARRTAFAIVTPILLSMPLWMPGAAIDAWVTPIKPGANLRDMAVDGIREPIAQGRTLLALFGPNCEACDRSIATLDRIAGTDGAPTVAAVFAGDNQARRAYVLEHVPAFPVGYSPEKALRQYYRRLPVFILMNEGIVERAWWIEPPDPTQVAAASMAHRTEG